MRRKFVTAVLMIAVVWMPFHLTNAYLRSDKFEIVKVQASDTVWSLAERYAGDDVQAKELREAIIEINGLNPDGYMQKGQMLKIPVLEKRNKMRLAGK